MRRLLSRLPLRLREIVAVVAALSVGYVVTSHLDVVKDDEKPFARSAAPGKTAHLSYADLKVLDVRTAKYVAPPVDTDTVALASGVFVVVVIEVTATREPTDLLSNWLTDDDGDKFRQSQRAGCSPIVSGDTGRPAYAMFCYEVPKDDLSSLRLEVGRGDDVIYDNTRHDDLADLDLGIDPKAAATSPDTTVAIKAVLDTTQPISVKEITIKGAS